jgi:hypothetical protein
MPWTSKGGSIVRSGDKIGMKQLFDDDSSTYTYLLWDAVTNDAVIVDPVDIHVDRGIATAMELNLNLIYGINTHHTRTCRSYYWNVVTKEKS